MLGRVEISAIFNLDCLVGILYKSPELALTDILGHFAVSIAVFLEPLLLEGVTLLLEATQRVFFALLKAKVFSCNETFGAVPVCLWDVVEWRIQAVGVIAKLTAVAHEHLFHVAVGMAVLTLARCGHSLGILLFHRSRLARCALRPSG